MLARHDRLARALRVPRGLTPELGGTEFEREPLPRSGEEPIPVEVDAVPEVAVVSGQAGDGKLGPAEHPLELRRLRTIEGVGDPAADIDVPAGGRAVPLGVTVDPAHRVDVVRVHRDGAPAAEVHVTVGVDPAPEGHVGPRVNLEVAVVEHRELEERRPGRVHDPVGPLTDPVHPDPGLELEGLNEVGDARRTSDGDLLPQSGHGVVHVLASHDLGPAQRRGVPVGELGLELLRDDPESALREVPGPGLPVLDGRLPVAHARHGEHDRDHARHHEAPEDRVDERDPASRRGPCSSSFQHHVLPSIPRVTPEAPVSCGPWRAPRLPRRDARLRPISRCCSSVEPAPRSAS